MGIHYKMKETPLMEFVSIHFTSQHCFRSVHLLTPMMGGPSVIAIDRERPNCLGWPGQFHLPTFPSVGHLPVPDKVIQLFLLISILSSAHRLPSSLRMLLGLCGRH